MHLHHPLDIHRTTPTYRRVSVPLHGKGEVTVTDLTKDLSSYTYCELYRINPANKARAQSLLVCMICRDMS